MSNQTVSSVNSNNTVTAQSLASNNKLNEQNFLQLLSTQLSNQDPSNPADETAMLAQLAQFATVEGVTNMATSQTEMEAAGLLGKTATASATINNTAVALSGTVTSVRWDGKGTYVTINDPTNGSHEVNLTQVSGAN